MTLKNSLISLLSDTKITLSDHQVDQLVGYVNLLDKWNKAYNLTSVRNPSDMLVKHILDSLVVGPLLEGNTFIDVGTGPGLPGIPLAIMYPEKKFYLLDSLGKRIRFIRQATMELKIDNVTAVQSRVEQYQPIEKLDGVLSRAFASLLDMVEWCEHLIDSDGRFYALKGLYPKEEIDNLPEQISFSKSDKLAVPGLEGERHLITLIKTT